MSSTLADSNIVLEKIGHVQLTPQQKAEGERARQYISAMISRAVEQSMAGKKVRAPKKQIVTPKKTSSPFNIDAGRMF